MRDLKLYYTEQEGFDINIVRGYAEYVDYANQSQDQRASVGATITQGTIPGALSIGANWGSVYEKESSLLDLYNQIQESVNNVSGGTGAAGDSYLPLLVPSENGEVSVTVLKGTLE